MSYQLHKKLVARTPTLPFCADVSEQTLTQKLSDNQFVEALYLASPVLCQEAIDWANGLVTDQKKKQKIVFSLAKYVLRMTTRSTPFGLFAGCGVADISGNTMPQVNEQQYSRNTRLDMHFVCALAQNLAENEDIKARILYFPNSSIYQIHDEIRYIEYRYQDGQRLHQITSVSASEYVDRVLKAAQKGILLSELPALLVEEDISLDEAQSFVNELVAAQVLVHELEPAITGDDFMSQIVKILQRINTDSAFDQIIKILLDIQEKLKSIDQKTDNQLSVYEEVIALIKPLNIPFEAGKLFQTDLVVHLNEGSPENQIDDLEASLNDLIEVLKLCDSKPRNSRLEEFKNLFLERYETQQLPLLEVLDTETGIGYGEQGKDTLTPLANDIELPNKHSESRTVKIGKVEQYFFELYEESLRTSESIVIDKAKLQTISQRDIQMPPSFSVLFRNLGENRYQLDSCGNSSAANLLGRFAHADPQIKDLVRQITTFEQTQNPDVCFAEIVHLPESRTGNILLHPVFRGYEIPYLGKSSLETDAQVLLQELSVSVSQGRVILYSKRLGKEIVPRLSNAHNYNQPDSLPVYQFLADLQTQDYSSGLRFSWDFLPRKRFTPAVSYKNWIIEPATWYLGKADFEALIPLLKENNEAIFWQTIETFWAKYRLANYLVLTDFDNELFINRFSKLGLLTWIDAIKNREEIVLQMFNDKPENFGIYNTNHQPYANQLVASMLNPDTPKAIATEIKGSKYVERSFSLGTKWLYFKIYCGVRMADKVLEEGLRPYLKDLEDKWLIDQWFFIRYADPHTHIRLRLHVVAVDNLFDVMAEIITAVEKFEESKTVWKICTDTYQRELERYGARTMELSEKWFYHDSKAIMQFLEKTYGDERENLRWLWGMRLIDKTLEDYGLTIEQKISLLDGMKTSFGQEFGMNKSLRIQMDNKYRNKRSEIEEMLADIVPQEYQDLVQLIDQKSADTTKIIRQIRAHGPVIEEYLPSVIHMSVNRLIADQQRLHELLMYDFLHKYYLSEKAKRKQ